MNTDETFRSSFCEDYKDHEFLGKGGYGIVFGAIEKDSDCPVAIKCVKLKAGIDQDNVLKELKILSQLDHRHVLRYHNRWKESSDYHRTRDQILNVNDNGRVVSLFTEDTSSSSSNRYSSDYSHSTQFSSSTSQSESNDVKVTTSSYNSDRISTDSHNSTDSVIENSEKSGASSSSSSLSKSSIYLFIVTSRCKSQSLRHHLRSTNGSNNGLNRITALHIFYQIVEGVKYLHDEKRLIHRDLKPENILFSFEDDCVKIADFGLTLMTKDMIETVEISNGNVIKRRGTPEYMPPAEELLTNKFDIYSMGIILFELLYPLPHNKAREIILADVRKSQPLFPEDFCIKYANERLKSVIRRLISHKPDERPTAHDLIANITIDIEANDLRKLKEIQSKKPSKLKKSDVAVHIEKVLTSPIIKQIHLTTDENQYGVFDTSDRYLLLAEDGKLKLFNLNAEQVGTSTYIHGNRAAGFVQRIVWCQILQQFLILCQHRLFVLTPDQRGNCGRINLIPHIKPQGNDKLRFISCTNDNKLFINHSYNKIEQYSIRTMFLYREWTKEILNYGNTDEIRRTTCSTTNEYIAFNVRLNKRNWVIDFRLIDDNLTLLKRIQIPELTLYHNLQLSDKEWLTIGEKDQFFVLDQNYKAIQIDSNVTIEAKESLDSSESNSFGTRRLTGVISFYELKVILLDYISINEGMAESNYPRKQKKSSSRNSSDHDSRIKSAEVLNGSSHVKNAAEKFNAQANSEVHDSTSSLEDETDTLSVIDNRAATSQPKQQNISLEIDSDEEEDETIKRDNSTCRLNASDNDSVPNDQQKRSNRQNTSKTKKDKHSKRSDAKEREKRNKKNEKTNTPKKLGLERLRSIIPPKWTIIDANICGKTHQGSIIKIQSPKEGEAVIKIYIFTEKDPKELRKLQTRALQERNALKIIKGMSNVSQFIESNIPDSIKEISESKEPLWTIMSYSPGLTLMQLIDDWKKNTIDIQPIDSIRFCQELLITIKSLHSKEIIHRDIKPANIMVDCNNHQLNRICSQCKFTLIDYGLAHMRTEINDPSSEKFRSSHMNDITVTDLQEDIGHSWCRVSQLAKASDFALRQMTTLEKYERKQLRRSPTIDPSSVCAILFTLMTKEHPGSARTASGLQPHERCYRNLQNLISKFLVNKVEDFQSRIEHYLMDTFDRGFGFPDIQWTIEQLEYRFNILLQLIDDTSNQQSILNNQMIQNNTIDEQLATQSKLSQILIRRPDFTQVAQAFSRAKKIFIKQYAVDNHLNWSFHSCQWIDDVNILHERKHLDILSCTHSSSQWSLFTIFHCYIDDVSDVIKVSIGTVIDGVTVLLPVARFNEKVQIGMIENRFIIELNTLIQLAGKNMIIPNIQDT
ncbi:hypothetical protein I4U23_023055 [Adineta vaga]|nr:hypothetical protein I4U23_023055 [Adineta vaga]